MTKSGRSKTGRIVALVVVVPVLVAGGLLAVVAISLGGGIDELFRGQPPRKGDSEVVEARQAAARDLADESALAEPALRTTEDARLLGGGHVQPSCQEGQHNWKIDDDFDLACDLTQIAVIATEASADFRDGMVTLHGELLADGWEERHTSRGGSGIPAILDGYWDARARFDPGYSMEDLPPASYERIADGRRESLEVGWAEQSSPTHQVTYANERAELRRADGTPATAQELVSGVPPGGYAVVLSRTVEYFRG